jgi:hypothetical protein
MSASSSISRPACARATCCQEGAPRLCAAAAAAATAAAAAAAAGVSEADGVGVADLRRTQPAAVSLVQSSKAGGAACCCWLGACGQHKRIGPWNPRQVLKGAKLLSFACRPAPHKLNRGDKASFTTRVDRRVPLPLEQAPGAWRRRAWLLAGPLHSQPSQQSLAYPPSHSRTGPHTSS